MFEEHSSSFSSPYLFNGKELDRETNLSYYGARYLDMKTSLWLNVDPMAEKMPNWSPYNFCMGNPLRLVDPDGSAPQDWINFTGKNGQQQIIYDSSVKTKAQAEAAGYTGVKQVFEAGTGSSTKTGEVVNFQKDGKFSVNGGNTMDTVDGGFTTQGGSYIGKNSNTLEQLAPVLSNTGDAAVVVGSIMCLTGVGAPIGAALITYGGYASTTGTVMDLTNDANNGTLTKEKVLTKAAMMAIPEVGGAAFKSLGAPAAKNLLNLETMAVDKSLDAMREAKAGPYKEN
ncbi:RHS repeat-associated core domain-containing protein [Flavobacterium sp. I-SCBP12n]|uniref:RHS repeat-associated core domain-containing protein n=1 Tax=Flavobacterium pygoscelis TaxID=2893176 RepID=A0A9X2BLE3_9FLAO|nr:RHS repeat-associated core domain-containing protein [Flavobacterium pygoscelis]MCK8141817.1 RHS repeat-associated core domain-containing protein [Flavobacterium pygoscelis]